MNMNSKLAIVMVFGSFSALAQTQNWHNLEAFFNPHNTFREVHIVALDDNYDHNERQLGTIHVHPIRPLTTIPSLKLMNNVYAMAAGMLRLRQIVRDYRIDLIAQTYGGPLKYGLPVVAVAQRAGLPSIISLHNDYRSLEDLTYSRPLRWASKLVWPYLFRNCTRVRSVSDYVAEFAYAHGVRREKVCVIPNKEVLGKFQTQLSDDELKQVARALDIAEPIHNSVVFLTVARLRPAKNLARMLQAFAMAYQSEPDIVYLIAGRGPLQAQLKTLAQRLGVAERVHFLGFVSHDQLRCIYHLSDVFLFATLYEGQPRVVIEALLTNLPIICANCGQVCDIVEDGQDGLWVNPLDVEDMATAITRLAADARLRAEMSRHLEFDAAQFSIERVGAQEADFYLSTIQRYQQQQKNTD